MLVYQRVYFLEQTSEYQQLELPAPPSDEYRLTRASQSPCPMRPLRPLPWEGQGKSHVSVASVVEQVAVGCSEIGIFKT